MVSCTTYCFATVSLRSTGWLGGAIAGVGGATEVGAGTGVELAVGPGIKDELGFDAVMSDWEGWEYGGGVYVGGV